MPTGVGRALRVGTRRSALALAQAEEVASALRARWAHGPVELVRVVTTGDRLQAEDPAAAGGRGVFVKELEAALLRGDVDLCVHSAKDVPPQLPEGLALVAFPPRADPRDVLVRGPGGGPPGGGLRTLPAGAAVATGSPRRAGQLLHLRPDLRVRPLRGNVDSRLRRVQGGEFDAAVLALAGLQRLRWAGTAEPLQPDEMVPAAGQGALVLEARADDPAVQAVLAGLDDAVTAFCVLAERAVLAGLGGGCTVPAGALAEPVAPGRFRLRAVVCTADGRRLVRAAVEAEVPPQELGDRTLRGARAAALGTEAVRVLRREGAEAILAAAGPA